MFVRVLCFISELFYGEIYNSEIYRIKDNNTGICDSSFASLST